MDLLPKKPVLYARRVTKRTAAPTEIAKWKTVGELSGGHECLELPPLVPCTLQQPLLLNGGGFRSN